jgi:hypothetical protein
MSRNEETPILQLGDQLATKQAWHRNTKAFNNNLPICAV